MRFIILTAFVFGCFSWSRLFAEQNSPKRGIPLNPTDLRQRFPLEDVKVWEPHTHEEVVYQGWPLIVVFDAVFGRNWRNAEVAWFECSDGYRPSLNISELKSGDAWLVIRQKGKDDFRLSNKLHHGEMVELGPLYLVWDNIKNRSLRKRGASGWPYQIVKAELASYATVFPKLAPPPASSQQVLRGFEAFKIHCLSCHKMNGEGGEKAPELNIPVNITEYIAEPWLKKWILDPASIRKGTLMPAFKDLPKAAQMVDDVVAYLKAMKKRQVMQ